MATEPDIITFLDSEGNEISNDPRWHARKVLSAAGDTDSQRVEQLEAQVEELQGKLEQATARVKELETHLTEYENATHGDESAGVEEVEESDGFDEMTVSQLKQFAADNKIDIKGLTKASEVRTRLREVLEANRD